MGAELVLPTPHMAQPGAGNARTGGSLDPAMEAASLRLDAAMAAARFHGAELDPRDFHGAPGETVPRAAQSSTLNVHTDEPAGTWASLASAARKP